SAVGSAGAAGADPVGAEEGRAARVGGAAGSASGAGAREGLASAIGDEAGSTGSGEDLRVGAGGPASSAQPNATTRPSEIAAASTRPRKPHPERGPDMTIPVTNGRSRGGSFWSARLRNRRMALPTASSSPGKSSIS